MISLWNFWFRLIDSTILEIILKKETDGAVVKFLSFIKKPKILEGEEETTNLSIFLFLLDKELWGVFF